MILINSYWNRTSATNALHRRLLFLHGTGGTGALWRPIAAALEEDFEILAPDQRGHGGSQIAFTPGGRLEPTYTPLDYGQDVIETMGEKNFHPAIVIGHSMGVRTACAVAHLKMEWVQGLVLIDLGFSGAAGGGLGDGLAQFLKILPLEFESRAAARQFMQDNCPDPSIGQYLMAVSIKRPTESGQDKIQFPFDKAALIKTIQAAKDSSVRTWVKDLGKEGLPILILRGANSLVWTQEEYQMEEREMNPFPSIQFREIQGAGHGLPFEKRAEFVQILRDWISTLF